MKYADGPVDDDPTEAGAVYFHERSTPYDFHCWGDMGGVGILVRRGHFSDTGGEYVKIRVVKPYWGCKKGQTVVVKVQKPKNHKKKAIKVSWDGKIIEADTNFPMYPTIKHRPFVFSTTTFDFEAMGYNRSWWYVDEEGGHVTRYYLHHVKRQKDGDSLEKSYKFYRAAMNSPSQRVKDAAIVELYHLVRWKSGEELKKILEDPLFPKKQRPYFYRWLK